MRLTSANRDVHELGDHLGARMRGCFDSVSVGDNFTSKPRLESIITLSTIAGRTRRLKLGTICLASFPLRHPLLLALQWASLDIASGGRTILAVCSGGSAAMGPQFAAELAAMGVHSKERIGRLGEGIDLLRAFWSGPVTHHGMYYHFDNVDLLPRTEPPHPNRTGGESGRPRSGRHRAGDEESRQDGRRLADRRHAARGPSSALAAGA